MLHFVVPDGIDDPVRPSGGNVYDRRLSDGLRAAGWGVTEHLLPGAWPDPSAHDRTSLAALLAALPDDATVLVDGLIASAAEPLVPAAARLRIVVLVHMPLAEAIDIAVVRDLERAVLTAAAAVITTSNWARDWIVTNHDLDADRVQVVLPGVDPSPPAVGSERGTHLLCVGPVTPAKGHDVLVAALSRIADLEWTSTCAGALDLDPEFFAQITEATTAAGLGERLVFTGPLTRTELAGVRSTTDLLLSASRRESYGMTVTEALAAGIPVIATGVGGHAEALGHASDGTVPGMLVPPDDPDALGAALRAWLTTPEVRHRWRASAALRARDLADWSQTAHDVARILRP
jgi:glycosyltransferase involved in cell wall biosynthesis